MATCDDLLSSDISVRDAKLGPWSSIVSCSETQPAIPRHAPVGVFDSGLGGLNLLRALRERLPHESFVYLGDTARVPYGTRSSRTVTRYARQVTQLLVDRGIKLLVVACNTVSAMALGELADALSPLPVIGVVEAAAIAACEASTHSNIAVIGTQSTVVAGAYEQAIARRQSDAVVVSRPCPLLVSLVEENWCRGPIVEAVVEHYLSDLRPTPGQTNALDCIVLGCTHFFRLRSALARVMGPEITLVDSALAIAHAVEQMLSIGARTAPRSSEGTVTLLATDGPERFAEIGGQFLGVELRSEEVSVVDL